MTSLSDGQTAQAANQPLPAMKLQVTDAHGFKADGSLNVNGTVAPHADFELTIRGAVGFSAYITNNDLWKYTASLEGFRDNVVFSQRITGDQSSIRGPATTTLIEGGGTGAEAVAGTRTTIDFAPFTATLDMGTLNGDVRNDFSNLGLFYQIKVHVRGVGGAFNLGALASVGDPFQLLGDPDNLAGFGFAPAVDLSAPSAVPEPGSLSILLAGPGALTLTTVVSRHRRKVRFLKVPNSV